MHGRSPRSVLYMPGSNERALWRKPRPSPRTPWSSIWKMRWRLMTRRSRATKSKRPWGTAAMAGARSSSGSTRSRRPGAPTRGRLVAQDHRGILGTRE